MELNRIKQGPLEDSFPFVLVAIMAFFVVMMFFASALAKWLPRYTFYWGDNVASYNKKMGRLKFFASGIVLALLTGILGNYFSSRLF